MNTFSEQMAQARIEDIHRDARRVQTAAVKRVADLDSTERRESRRTRLRGWIRRALGGSDGRTGGQGASREPEASITSSGTEMVA